MADRDGLGQQAARALVFAFAFAFALLAAPGQLASPAQRHVLQHCLQLLLALAFSMCHLQPSTESSDFGLSEWIVLLTLMPLPRARFLQKKQETSS